LGKGHTTRKSIVESTRRKWCNLEIRK